MPTVQFRLAFVVFAGCATLTQAIHGGEKPKETPPFSEIEKAVCTVLAGQGDYRPGDLITKGQAAEALDAAKRLGFAPQDADAILGRLLDDSDYLAKALRTPRGKSFMRKISGMPNGYDRLDRLARMPQGTATVESLIRGPGGEKMIEYMTQTPGGRNLGKQLSRTPTGGDFNAPTGRIYTEKALIACLKQEYDGK